jgi:hypothetical protein
VPRGVTINANLTIIVLDKFMKHLRIKRPEMVEQEWFLHWDYAPVHTAAIVKNWLAARAIQVLPHPPYSPDLAPADFFFSFLLVQKGEGGAGRPPPDPGQPQERLERGPEDHRLRRVRRRLQALVRALQEVYPHWG